MNYKTIKENQIITILKKIILFSFICFAFASTCFALPEIDQIISGSVDFVNVDSNTLQINASDKAIVNYKSFSIEEGKTVIFNMPSADSSILNRVTGNSSSQILGALNSNGIVFLVNENGIYFGPSASINVKGLVASTRDITDSNFLSSNYVFEKTSKDKTDMLLLNEGNINIQEAGFGVFIAGAIENRGVVIANLGTIAMAAGEMVTLGIAGSGSISIAINKEQAQEVLDWQGNPVADQIGNTGRLEANGGVVLLDAESVPDLFEKAINLEGIVKAERLDSRNATVKLVSNGYIKAGITDSAVCNLEIVRYGDINLTSSLLNNEIINLKGDHIDLTYLKTQNLSLEASEAINTLPGVIIQANQVKLSAKKFGSTINPIIIEANLTHINRTSGNIDILESIGLGSSILLRGPPEDNFAIIYNSSTNLTLEAEQVNILGSAPTYLYGNITFYNFNCAITNKVLYFEAGNEYIFRGSLNITGAPDDATGGRYIKLASQTTGLSWYFNLQTNNYSIDRVEVSDCYSRAYLFIERGTDLGNNTNLEIDPYWDGGGADANWSTPENWENNTLPAVGSAITFGAEGTGHDSIIDAGWTRSIGSLTINATYSGTISIVAGASLTITGAFIQNGAIFTTNGEALSVGSFTMNGGTFNAGASTITCNGNWTYTAGTFNADSGTVKFYLFSSCAVNGSLTFNNLEVAGAGTVQALNIASGTILTVNGTLSITPGSGNVIINTGDIHVKGDIVISNLGTCGGTATITINGTGNQTITGSGVVGAGRLPKVNINKTSGNLTLSGIISIGTDWTYTSMGTGSLITTGSTVAFMLGIFTVTGSHTLNDVQIVGAGSVQALNITSGTVITVNGTLSITGSGSAIINTGDIHAKGQIVITNTYASQAGTATITINGTGDQSITNNGTMGNGRLPNVTIDKLSGVFSLIGNVYVSGTFRVISGTVNTNDNPFTMGAFTQSGGTFNAGSSAVICSGTFTMYGGTFNAGTDTISVGDDFLIYAGTFNADSGNVKFTGAPIIQGDITFNNMEFYAIGNDSMTLSSDTTITINGNFTISGNNLGYINGGTINLKGDLIITNTETGGAAGGTTNIIMNGAGNQTIYGTSNVNYVVLPTITINKASGDLILSGDTGSNFINIGGNWNYVSMGTGSLITTGSIVVFSASGSSSITITGTHSLNNVNFYATSNNSLIINLGTILTVNGTLTISGNNINQINGGTINVKGDFLVTNTEAVGNTGGGSTNIVINGTGNQLLSYDPTSYMLLPNLIIDRSNEEPGTKLTLSGIINVGTSWKYVSGTIDASTNDATIAFYSSGYVSGTHTLQNVNFVGSANPSTYNISNILTVSGTLTISGNYGCILNRDAGEGIINVLGDISIANTATTGGGTATIYICGSSTQTITNTGAAGQGRLPNITINKTGVLILPTQLSLVGDWVYAAGTVDAITNSSTVNLVGTTPQVINSGNQPFYNLTFNNTSSSPGMNWDYVILDATDLTVGNIFTITDGRFIQSSRNVTAGTISIGTAGAWINNSTGDITIGAGGMTAAAGSSVIWNGFGGLDRDGDPIVVRGSNSTARIFTISGTYTFTDINVDYLTTSAAYIVTGGTIGAHNTGSGFTSGTLSTINLWEGDVDSNWSTAGNWSLGHVPTTNENAVFDASSPNCTINSTVNVSTLTINLTSGYTGTVTQNSAVTTANLYIAGGTYLAGNAGAGTYTLTVGSSFQQTGGTFTGRSSNVDINGTFDLMGDTSVVFTAPSGTTSSAFTLGRNFSVLDRPTFNNNGTITFDYYSTTYAVRGVIGSLILNNLTFNSSGYNCSFYIAPTTALTVIGTLNIAGANMGGIYTGIINAQGDIVITNTAASGSSSWVGSATININGSGNQTISSSVASGLGWLPKVVINKPSGDLILSGVITVASAWDYVGIGGGGSLITTGSTLVFYMGPVRIFGSQTLNNVSFYTYTTTIIDVYTTLTVLGELTWSGLSTYHPSSNGGYINAYGNITLGSASGVGGGGTTVINIVGTGDQILSGSDNVSQCLPQIVINKPSGNLTLSGVIGISSNFTYIGIGNGGQLITTDSTLYFYWISARIIGDFTLNNLTFYNWTAITIDPSAVITVLGDLTFDSNGSQNITLNSGTINLYGDLIVTSNTTAGGGGTTVINFVGSQDQSIDTTDTVQQRLPCIVIDKSGGVLTLSNMILFGNNFKYIRGDVDAITNNSTAIFYNAAYLDGQGTNSTMAFDNVIFAGTTYLTGALDIDGDLTINATYSLTNSSNSAISIAGNWLNSGSFVSGNATVTFDGSVDSTIITGGTAATQDFYNVVINKSGDAAAQLVTNGIDIDNALTIASGKLDLNGLNIVTTTSITVKDGAALKLTGDETVSSIPTLDTGSIVEYSATSLSRAIKDWTYSNLTINGNGGTFLMGVDEIIGGNLVISAGTFDINGKNLTVNGIFTNNGTFKLTGNETTVSFAHGMDTDSGIVEYYGTATASLKLGNDYHDLILNGSGTWEHSALLTLYGNLTIALGNTLNSNGQNINIAGNWTNNGTYSSGLNTVTFNGTNQAIYGDNIFNNLTKNTSNATFTFEADKTQRINGVLILTGSIGNLLKLRSTIAGTYWNINPQGTYSISYVDVKDSNNISGTDITPLAGTSYSSGHNFSWVLPSAFIWIGGEAGGSWADSTKWSSGQVPGASDIVVFDNNSGSGTSIIDILNVSSIYLDSGYNGVVTMSATSLTANGDIIITSGTFQSGAQTLTINGTLSTQGGTFTGSTGIVDVNGSVTISSGIFTAPSGNFTVSGNWTKTGGTFNAGTNTVIFDGIGTQLVNAGGAGNGNAFYNLTHSGSGILRLTDNDFDVDNIFDNSNGTYDAATNNINMFFGNNWTNRNTAIFLRGSGILTFDGAITLINSSTNAADLGDLTITGTITLGSDITIISVSGSGTLNLGAGNYTLTISGIGTPLTVTAFNKGTGSTVKYTGNDSTNIALVSYNNLQLSGSGPYILAGHLTGVNQITGNLTLDSGSSLNTNDKNLAIAGSLFNNGTFTGTGGNLDVDGSVTLSGGNFIAPSSIFTVAGDWTRAGGVFTAGSSTVIFDKSEDTQIIRITGGSGNFYNLSHAGNGTLQINNNITIANDLINSSGVFTVVGGSQYWIYVGGNWLNTSTFTPNIGVVEFYKASGIQTVNNGASAFYQLRHTGAGTLRLIGSDLDVNSAFYNTTGTFDSNNLNMSFASLWQNTGSATFIRGSGTLTFDGTTTLTNSSSNAASLGAVIITGSVTLGSDLTVASVSGVGTFNMGTGRTLTLTSSGTPLTVTTFNRGTDSTVKYAGTSVTDIATIAYNNLQFSGATTYSLIGNLTEGNALTGNLIIDLGATLDTNGNNITLAGNWDNSGTFVADQSTVMFTSATIQTLKSNNSSFYNLNHSNTGTLKLIEDPLTVTGTLTNAYGTFDANGQAVTVTGLVEISNGNYLAGSGKQTFNGGLTISGGTFTGSTGDVDINGDLTLSSGTLISPTGEFTVSGNWTNTDGIFTCGTGTVIFDGTSTLTPYSIKSGYSSFNNVEISIGDASNIQLSDNFVANGEMIITSGIFDANGRTVTIAGLVRINGGEYWASTAKQAFNGGLELAGGIFWGSSGEIDVNGNLSLISGTLHAPPAGIFTVSGNWIVSEGIFDHSNGTVELDGTSTQNITSNNSSFFNIIFNGLGGTWNLADNLVIENNLTVEKGTLKPGSHTITISGNFTINDGFDCGTSTVEFIDASKPSYIYGTTFYNLKFATPGKEIFVQAGATETIIGELTILGDASGYIKLRSTIEGTPWNINSKGTFTIDYVDVKDSHNIGSIVFNPVHYIDNGDTQGWFKSQAQPVNGNIDAAVREIYLLNNNEGSLEGNNNSNVALAENENLVALPVQQIPHGPAAQQPVPGSQQPAPSSNQVPQRNQPVNSSERSNPAANLKSRSFQQEKKEDAADKIVKINGKIALNKFEQISLKEIMHNKGIGTSIIIKGPPYTAPKTKEN